MPRPHRGGPPPPPCPDHVIPRRETIRRLRQGAHDFLRGKRGSMRSTRRRRRRRAPNEAHRHAPPTGRLVGDAHGDIQAQGQDTGGVAPDELQKPFLGASGCSRRSAGNQFRTSSHPATVERCAASGVLGCQRLDARCSLTMGLGAWHRPRARTKYADKTMSTSI